MRPWDGRVLRAALAAVACVVVAAGGAEAAKKRLCVRKITATDAVNRRYGKSVSLAKVLDALDGQLIQEIQRRRKFEVVADSALKEVLDTQDRNLGLGGGAPSSGIPAVASCEYTLVVRVDDFQDSTVSKAFEGGTVVESRRTLRVGATAQIYREDGTLLEAVDFRKSGAANSSSLPGAGIGTGGGMLASYAEALASRVADYTTDYIFPATILASSMGVVTLNRGAGTGIAVGQIWEARIEGRVLTDPDTGEVLGSEEASVGWVKVIEVQPKLSRAEILLDEGIAEGNLLRQRPKGLPVEVKRKISLAREGRRSAAPPAGERLAEVTAGPGRTAWLGFPSSAFAQDDPAVAGGEREVTEPAPDIEEPVPAATRREGPPRLAIFVKNRDPDIPESRVMALEDEVTAAATNRGFRVINREDAINAVSSFASEGANAGGSDRLGEQLDRQLSDSTSALALARNLGADFLLLVSVTSFEQSKTFYRDQGRDIAVTNRHATLRSTYRVTSGITGETVAADNVVVRDAWRDSPNLKREEDELSDRLLAESAQQIATSLQARRPQVDDAGVQAADAEIPIQLFATMADLSIPEIVQDDDGQLRVSANTYQLEVMSVEVDVDGLTVGTTGPRGETFKVAPGLHRLRLHRTGFTPVERVISAKPGLRIMIPMELSEAGYGRWQQNTAFLNDLKAGDRLNRAQAEAFQGLGTFLKDSYLRLGPGAASSKTDRASQTAP